MSSVDLNFKLLPRADYRPVFYAKFGSDNLFCLLDTGSDIPTFTGGLNYFMSLFPSAKFYKESMVFGYGGGSKYNIYIVPKLVLSDGKSSLVIRNYYSIVCDKMSKQYEVLLCASMFSRSKLLLDFEKKACSISFSSNEFYGAFRQDSVFYIFSKEEEESRITAAAMRKSLDDKRKE